MKIQNLFSMLSLMLPLALPSTTFALGAKSLDSAFDDSSTECRTRFDQYVKMGYSLKSLSVPENWQNPAGKQIRIAYYLKDDFQKKNVVLFFNGGPAASAMSSLSNLKLLSDKHPVNFVVFDQRGTGCSSTFPKADEELALYTSASIVNDAEALRSVVMGTEKWKIFGQSYGGLIVQRYLERRPEGVSHAYAHGYSQMNDPSEWMALRLKRQAELSLERINAFDAKNRNRDLLKKLQRFPETACVESNNRKFCGRELIDAMFLYLGFQSVDFAETMSGFSETATRMPHWQQWMSQSVIKPFFDVDRPGTIIATVDMSGSRDIDMCLAAEKTKTYTKNKLGISLINECRFQKALMRYMDGAPIASSVQGDLLKYDVVKSNIQKHQIQCFLYSSAKDSFVPPSVFAEQVQLLGSAVRYVEFPKSGHEGFATEVKIISDLSLDSSYISDEDH